MAIEGINTGSGYSGYGAGKGIGSLSRESISKTSGNSVSAGNGAGGVSGGLGVSSEPLENQVAVSPDGDTVQISKKAVAKYDAASEAKKSEKLDENEQKEALGNVRKNQVELKAEQSQNARKAEKAKSEKRTAALKELAQKEQKREAEKAEDKEDISFTGKSDSDIKRLYLEGEISKNDYDSEMKVREKLREVLAKRNEDAIKMAAERNSIAKKLERFAESIKATFSDTTSRTFDAGVRLDAIDIAEGTKKERDEASKSDKKEVKFVYN